MGRGAVPCQATGEQHGIRPLVSCQALETGEQTRVRLTVTKDDNRHHRQEDLFQLNSPLPPGRSVAEPKAPGPSELRERTAKEK